MNMEYFAIYSSTQSGVTGCVKQFLTEPITGNTAFPPQVEYECDLCNRKHGFRLKSWHMASTKRQKDAILAYATKENLEFNVKVPVFTR